jgi:hypothetical protein
MIVTGTPSRQGVGGGPQLAAVRRGGARTHRGSSPSIIVGGRLIICTCGADMGVFTKTARNDDGSMG